MNIATARRRTTLAATGAAIFFLLAGGLALTSRAQATAPSGRQVALGLEESCADKSQVFYAMAEDGVSVLGRWITVAGPTFGLDPAAPRPALTAHAVDPLDPRRILVSDGTFIQLSEDGGCNWAEVHEADNITNINLSGELVIQETIRQLEMVALPSGARRAWALLAPAQDGAGAVRVVTSDDGGEQWVERSAGLPALHSRFDTTSLDCTYGPCPAAALAVAPSDPDTAYLVVSRQTSSDFFRTTDGGRSWTSVIHPSNFSTQGYFGFQVSPVDPLEVWVINHNSLMVSRDGGTTWAGPLDDISQATALHLGMADGRVSVQVGEVAPAGGIQVALHRSLDGGATFQRIELSSHLSGFALVAQGGSPDQLVVSTDEPDGAFRYSPADLRFGSLSATELGDVNDPVRDETAEPVHWFRQFAALAAFVPGPLPPGKVPPVVGRPSFDPGALDLAAGDRVPGDLRPERLEADLGNEGSRLIDYRLDLPALPTPVDVWFLIDTSGSMAGAIEGLQTGIGTIIDELRASGLDAWFGLATFPAQRVIYDRQADLAPPNDEFYEALERLDTDGGTAEIHPTALYQSVTGAGQEDAGIPEGRGATFRPQALKIIVHATDEAYGRDSSGPTQEEAAEAMEVVGVRHVGLDLAAGAADPTAGADGGGPRSTKRDHDKMAIATGTLAPAEGIDCNGDGLNELEAGDPVTCPIVRGRDSLEIAPAIIAAVRAVRDETEVALHVVESGGLTVEIENPSRSPVNMKVANSLPFPVRYTCPPEMNGRVGTVSLQATVRGALSAGGVARIGCGAPVVPPPPPRASPAALVPLVLGPPQLVPDLEPALGPLNQPSPANVGQPVPQPGLAAQPGEVATAKQRAGRDGPAPPAREQGDGRAERDSSAGTAGTIGAGAALAVGLGGWAVRRERRPVPVHARA